MPNARAFRRGTHGLRAREAKRHQITSRNRRRPEHGEAMSERPARHEDDGEGTPDEARSSSTWAYTGSAGGSGNTGSGGRMQLAMPHR